MTIQRAREILEKDGKKYTDEEVLEFINTADIFSDMALDAWFKMTPAERKAFDKNK